jgi:hypothetical protein
MHWRIGAIVSSAAIALSSFLGQPWSAEANHAWGPYHWPRYPNSTNDVPLTILRSVSGTWTSYVNSAIKDSPNFDWNDSSRLNLTISSSATDSKTRKRCPTSTGRIRVCDESFGFNGWLGIASIWIDSNNHITQATTKLNNSYFNTSSYNTPGWRQFVACQEIGHDFGLDHQDENFGNYNLGTCMDYTNSPDGGTVGGFNYGPNNLYPNAHDLDELATIYSHSHIQQVSGEASAPSGKKQADDEEEDTPTDPKDFGKAVGKQDKLGRHTHFEQDLGNGKKRLTHVFWVDKGKPGADNAR